MAGSGNVDKQAMYRMLLEQLKALCEGEREAIPNLANASALIYQALPDVNWAGFYLNVGNELMLGPFQGKPACIRIPFDRGVCGAAAREGRTQRVRDVHAFVGHIACDGDSQSEIVVPMVVDGRVVAVLDVDSPVIGRFDEVDQQGLEELASVICDAVAWE